MPTFFLKPCPSGDKDTILLHGCNGEESGPNRLFIHVGTGGGGGNSVTTRAAYDFSDCIRPSHALMGQTTRCLINFHE